jgi:hypothetical protein
VINTATNTVAATIPVGAVPNAFGIFIIRPIFAGHPNFSNCYGQSIAALGSLTTAAAALDFPSATALQNAVQAFCE